jgi:hypothetical protein
MPRDATTLPEIRTARAKLIELAEFMDELDNDLLDLRTVHHACGTAHCAWGWGEVIGLFPKSEDEEADSVWAAEMESAQEGLSRLLGLNDTQFRRCFGMGYQFRKLGRPYTPADVARNLRATAAELSNSSAVRAA